MIPWETLEVGEAPDGTRLELRRRAQQYLITAGGYDLMSSEDEGSSRALGSLGCAHLDRSAAARVLVGGLGMGYTVRAVLDQLGGRAAVEVAELSDAVVQWNDGVLGPLAAHPLRDRRTALRVEDVACRMRAAQGEYDAILLDVDNGPAALVHRFNDALYGKPGVDSAWSALRPGGVFGVWSFTDDAQFTKRLQKRGFDAKAHRVPGSRKGRGRYHWIWVARKAVGNT